MKVFYLDINLDDQSGMDAISLVEYPAVEINYLKFDNSEPVNMLFSDDEKRIITGVVCLADTPIYRNNPTYGEHYVVFKRDMIEKMIDKYSKDGLFNSVNLQHNDNKFVDGVYMVESYIKNSERGITPVEFANIPDGSWICSYKVDNLELWEQIKNSKMFNGFSLQGMFKYVDPNEEVTKNNFSNMGKKLGEYFTKAICKLLFTSISTDKGVINYEGDLVVGTEVFVQNGDEIAPAEDGEYIAEDGQVIVIANGTIAEVREPEQPNEEPADEPTEEQPAEDEKPEETTEPEEPKEEETPAEEEPADEPNDEVEDLKKQIEEKNAKIAELEAKIAELESKTAEQEEALKMSTQKSAKEVAKQSKQNAQFKTYFNK